MTLQELRQKLSVIEPTEEMYAGLSEADIAPLTELLSDPEPWLAGRAVFALSRIETPKAIAAIVRAAADPRETVRVSVATAVAQRKIVLPDKNVVALLSDPDLGVRKYAALAVKPDNGADAHAALRRVAEADANLAIRDFARQAVEKLRPIRPR